jgi:membrane-bound lytic murein transglycosylase
MGSTIINKSNNNGYIDSKNEMISNLKKHMKSLEDQINLISKKIDNYKKIPGGEQTAKELEFKQCGLKTQQLDIKKQVEYYEKCITEQKNRIQNNKVSLKKDSIKNANTNLANFKTKIFKPGTISEKSDAEQTKETIWALAYEEKRIGGWNKMKNAYGNVDITEHALFGDPILK